MPIVRKLIGATVIGLCGYAIVRGVFLWLSTHGIHPDQWVASMLTWASASGVLSAITWTIAGVIGLAGLLLWPKIEEFIWSIFTQAQIPLTAVLREAET